MNIKIQNPDENAPGYLQRLDDFLHLNARMTNLKNHPETALSDVDIFRDMAKFMLPYISEPEDKDIAFQEIMNASKTEFDRIWVEFSSAMGGAVPPTKGGSSSTGSGTNPSLTSQPESPNRRRKHPSKASV